MKTQYKIALIFALVAGILFAASLTVRPTTAQGDNASLRALLEKVRDNNTAVTIEFGRPLVSGELIWMLPDSTRKIGEVGDDYVCFSEPWNDTTKDRCTPFSNIVGVSFVR